MKVINSFQTALKQLNQEQRAAVDTIDGPVMVVAGPGTGKTQVIALRIANILQKTDTEPDAILALTFTESGARAMRERLLELIGPPAYYVQISTFHAFCVQVIRDHPDYFQLDPSQEPLSELERLELVQTFLSKGSFQVIKPVGAPLHYTKAVLGAISDLKREGIDPEEFSELLDQEADFLDSSKAEELTKTETSKRRRNLSKQRELLVIYQDYQQALTDSRRFDFEDMINSVTTVLTKEQDLLRSLQERFHYLLVDEYQDTNSAQNELLLLLTSFWGQDANLFVVGDPDQSIYRFQGASIENQLEFIKHFPSSTVITLRENYRSTQSILDAADSLIAHNNLRINDVVPSVDPHLTSQSGKGSKLRLATLSSHPAELVFLAEDIKQAIKKGTPANEIAVIYRTNDESAAIADTFAKFGLDYQVQGGANVLEDPTVKNFVKILRVVDELKRKQEDEDLFTILHYDLFKIESLDVLKLSRYASDHKLSLFDLLANQALLDELELTTRPALDSTLELLTTFSKLDANLVFTDFFEQVLNVSGYLNWVLKQPEAHHRLARINTLFDEVKRMNRASHTLNLAGFLRNLQIMEDNHLRLDENSYGKSEDAVTLTTAHSSKGLEWDHVYLTRAIDAHWGNNHVRTLLPLPDNLLPHTNLNEKEKNEDERRLFYVALTRGRKSVTLTHAKEYSSFGRTRASAPSMFLAELGDSHTSELDTTKIETEAHTHLENLLKSPTLAPVSTKETPYLEELVANFALSVTSLNTYLECPYKFKLDKLYKVPHSKKPHLAFGTAVHSALESFYREFKDTSHLPDKDFLLTEFTTALDKEILTKDDHATRLEQGQAILSSYYDYFQDDFKEPLFLEKFFRVVLPTQPGSPVVASAKAGGSQSITLTGKIDRIEWYHPEPAEGLDPKDRLVKVVDYKTGKGKTKGQIEGTTKDSGGDLKRQLVFYKLLLDLDRRLKNISFGAAELDFIEVPDEKGKSGRHTVRVTADEVGELKKLIKKVMADIKDLKFPRTTDYSICGNCDFRDHCYPSGLPTR